MENGGRTRTRSPSLAMESDTQTLYAKGEGMIKCEYCGKLYSLSEGHACPEEPIEIQGEGMKIERCKTCKHFATARRSTLDNQRLCPIKDVWVHPTKRIFRCEEHCAKEGEG